MEIIDGMFRIMEYEKTDGGVAALARGLELLRCFTAQTPTLANGELAERCNLPKSTVSRLTRTLVELGYLRLDGRMYSVGPAVLALGYAALAHLRVRDLARPLMQSLADATQTLVSLATRERLAMIYLENCRGANNVTLRVAVGTQLPLATTSVGRAFLAGLPPAERDFLLEQLARREGADWPAQWQAVERELRRHAALGYCLSLGEWKRDTNAAATPLRLPGNGDLLVLSIGGPAFNVTERILEEDLAPRLVALARHVKELAGLSAN